MIKNVIDKNSYYFHGYDKVGRPIIWMRMAAFNPEGITTEIYDMDNSGWGNVSMEIGKVTIQAS